MVGHSVYGSPTTKVSNNEWWWVWAFNHSGVAAGCAGLDALLQTFWFVKNLSRISKNWVKKLRHFWTILMQSYFLWLRVYIKVYYVIENTLSIYKINKLFLVISRFLFVIVVEYLTNLKVWAKKAFHLCALLIVHCGNRVCCRAPASYQASANKLLFLNLTAVFGWTHFAIQFVVFCIYVQYWADNIVSLTAYSLYKYYDTCHHIHVFGKENSFRPTQR